MKINESILNESINKQINRIINEANESTKLTNRLINILYKRMNSEFGGVYADSGWQNVDNACKTLASTEGVADFNISAGQYENYLNGDSSRPPVRRYKLQFTTEFGTTIDGELQCNAAGTVEDPFSKYDMTISLWRNTGDNF